MTTPLLSTKLSPPQLRAGLVPRPRLTRLLDDGVQPGHKLTLVCAPAGYGKTTLVADWLALIPERAAWLSLEADDGDPARFLAYLLAALQTIDPRIGRAAQRMAQAPQPPPTEALLPALTNELALVTTSFVVVLDDYHLIQALPVHQVLTFLMEHGPANMHLVIITREDPPLPLSRLRARAQIVELRQADLRFTEAEATAFLGRVPVDLSAAEVATLYRRVEGWVAGLQLAALSLQGRTDVPGAVRSFADSPRYLLDYLLDEVFDRQPADVQQFLLQTAILERLSPALCDAVTGRSDSKRMLSVLEHANLFITPLDAAGAWYRYHPLFADLLRHRLDLGITDVATDVGGLHRRASRWFAQQRLFPEAIGHALAGCDWTLAAELIDQASSPLLRRGELITLINWFGMLPPEIVHARSRLCLDYAWPLLLAGQHDAAAALLERAASLAPAEEPPPDGDLRSFQGQIATARSYLARARGDLRRSAEMAHQALTLLPEAEAVTRSVVGVNLGMAYWHAGRMAEAEPVFRQALQGRASLRERLRPAHSPGSFSAGSRQSAASSAKPPGSSAR